MFNTDDLIVYGSTGVCRVTEISKLDNISVADNDLYYVLTPLFQNGIIYTPVNNPKVFMRPVISMERAKELMDIIPSVEAEPYYNPNIQKLVEHYDGLLKTHDCMDLIQLAVSILKKRCELKALNKKLGQIDERFAKKAEELLCGELSVALNVPKEEVQDYIENNINGLNT